VPPANQPARDGVNQIRTHRRQGIVAPATRPAHANPWQRPRALSTAWVFLALMAMTPSFAPTASMASSIPFTSCAACADDGGVLVQERLAFRAVGDHGVGFGSQLDMRGKTPRRLRRTTPACRTVQPDSYWPDVHASLCQPAVRLATNPRSRSFGNQEIRNCRSLQVGVVSPPRRSGR